MCIRFPYIGLTGSPLSMLPMALIKRRVFGEYLAESGAIQRKNRGRARRLFDPKGKISTTPAIGR